MSNAVRSPRSIPTVYRGVRYRSKLEADYARAFDTLRLEHEYEREGAYYGDVFYFPDFFLPQSQQYVEVKGVFQPDDCRKIQALLANVPPRLHTSDECPDIRVVACEPDGVFRGWVRRDGSPLEWFDFLTKQSVRVELMQCARCRGWWFCDPEWSWRCQCCGAYEGNGHVSQVIQSPFPDFPSLFTLKGL
jgi:hypothetical protein